MNDDKSSQCDVLFRYSSRTAGAFDVIWGVNAAQRRRGEKWKTSSAASPHGRDVSTSSILDDSGGLERQQRPSLPDVSLSLTAAGSRDQRGAMSAEGGDAPCSARRRRKSVSEPLRLSGPSRWGGQNIQLVTETQTNHSNKLL